MRTCPDTNPSLKLLATAALFVPLASCAALPDAGMDVAGPDTTSSCQDGRAIVVVGAAASEQHPDLAGLAHDVAYGAVVEALTCAQDAVVMTVAGGASRVVLEADQIAGELGLERLPNERVRARRLSNHSQEVREMVDDALNRGRGQLEGATRLSLPALYAAAGERAADGDRVVVITHGVHVDEQITLNRPLEEGEGEAVARELSVVALDQVDVTLAGLTHLDAEVPVPGHVWPAEVIAAARASCEATGAASCRVFSSATPREVLDG